MFIKRTWKPTLFGILVPQYVVAQQSNRRLLMSKAPTAAGGGGGGASFTFVNKNHSTSVGASATSSVQLTGVTAGNLIVVASKWEGGAGETTTGISDGTTAFSLGTQKNHANNDLHWIFGYLLVSVASGTVTYTVTHSGGTGAHFWTFVMEFSGGGTRAFDTEPTGGGASGTSTAPNSGNMTTGAANAVVFGGYSHYNAVTPSSLQIGGVAKDGSQPTTPGSSESTMWYRILTGVMTNGAAACTLSGSSEWVCNGLSIKAT